MKEIRLAMSGGYGFAIDADCIGEWAIHKDIDGLDGDWTVTHVPTGLRIPRYLTEQQARVLAERLAVEVPTLGVPAGLPAKQPTVADFGPGFAETIKRVSVIVDGVLGL